MVTSLVVVVEGRSPSIQQSTNKQGELAHRSLWETVVRTIVSILHSLVLQWSQSLVLVVEGAGGREPPPITTSDTDLTRNVSNVAKNEPHYSL